MILEEWFKTRRSLWTLESIWWSGAILGIPVPLLLAMEEERQFPLVWVAVAGGLLLWLGTAGLYSFWMARLPGGLKGWRLGLLLLPGVNVVWNLFETWRITNGVMRNASRPQRALAILSGLLASAALLTAAGLLGYHLYRSYIGGYYFMDGYSSFFGFALILLIWLVAFSVMGNCLNRMAWVLPIQPASVTRRRRQLGIVLGVGIVLPLTGMGVWWASEYIRVGKIEKRYAALMVPSISAETPPAKPVLLAERPTFLIEWPPGYEEKWRRSAAEAVRAEEHSSPAYRAVAGAAMAQAALLDGNREAFNARIAAMCRTADADTAPVLVETMFDILQWSMLTGRGDLLDDAVLVEVIQWCRDVEPVLFDLCRLRLDAVYRRYMEERRGGTLQGPRELSVHRTFLEGLYAMRTRCEDSFASRNTWSLFPDWNQKIAQVEAALKACDQGIDLARVMRVGLACELYRRRHGYFPGNLADLVPGYLDALPQDRYGWGADPVRTMQPVRFARRWQDGGSQHYQTFSQNRETVGYHRQTPVWILPQRR